MIAFSVSAKAPAYPIQYTWIGQLIPYNYLGEGDPTDVWHLGENGQPFSITVTVASDAQAISNPQPSNNADFHPSAVVFVLNGEVLQNSGDPILRFVDQDGAQNIDDLQFFGDFTKFGSTERVVSIPILSPNTFHISSPPGPPPLFSPAQTVVGSYSVTTRSPYESFVPEGVIVEAIPEPNTRCLAWIGLISVFAHRRKLRVSEN